jgi:hypothetical protein
VSGPTAAAAATLSLHLPDEPAHRREWLEAVLDGTALETVVGGEAGVTSWLWSRWRSLGAIGFDEASLGAVVLGYRREIWLWLLGDRTWEQCCSGLIGRIGRRLPS